MSIIYDTSREDLRQALIDLAAEKARSADLLAALVGLVADLDAHAHGRAAPGHTTRIAAARTAITKVRGQS